MTIQTTGAATFQATRISLPDIINGMKSGMTLESMSNRPAPTFTGTPLGHASGEYFRLCEGHALSIAHDAMVAAADGGHSKQAELRSAAARSAPGPGEKFGHLVLNRFTVAGAVLGALQSAGDEILQVELKEALLKVAVRGGSSSRALDGGYDASHNKETKAFCKAITQLEACIVKCFKEVGAQQLLDAMAKQVVTPHMMQALADRLPEFHQKLLANDADALDMMALLQKNMADRVQHALTTNLDVGDFPHLENVVHTLLNAPDLVKQPQVGKNGQTDDVPPQTGPGIPKDMLGRAQGDGILYNYSPNTNHVHMDEMFKGLFELLKSREQTAGGQSLDIREIVNLLKEDRDHQAQQAELWRGDVYNLGRAEGLADHLQREVDRLRQENADLRAGAGTCPLHHRQEMTDDRLRRFLGRDTQGTNVGAGPDTPFAEPAAVKSVSTKETQTTLDMNGMDLLLSAKRQNVVTTVSESVVTGDDNSRRPVSLALVTSSSQTDPADDEVKPPVDKAEPPVRTGDDEPKTKMLEPPQRRVKDLIKQFGGGTDRKPQGNDDDLPLGNDRTLHDVPQREPDPTAKRTDDTRNDDHQKGQTSSRQGVLGSLGSYFDDVRTGKEGRYVLTNVGHRTHEKAADASLDEATGRGQRGPAQISPLDLREHLVGINQPVRKIPDIQPRADWHVEETAALFQRAGGAGAKPSDILAQAIKRTGRPDLPSPDARQQAFVMSRFGKDPTANPLSEQKTDSLLRVDPVTPQKVEKHVTFDDLNLVREMGPEEGEMLESAQIPEAGRNTLDSSFTFQPPVDLDSLYVQGELDDKPVLPPVDPFQDATLQTSSNQRRSYGLHFSPDGRFVAPKTDPRQPFTNVLNELKRTVGAG